MKIAVGRDLKIEESRAGEALKHVIEEGNPGPGLTASRAVKLEFDFNRSFARFALDGGSPARSCYDRRHDRLSAGRDGSRSAFVILRSGFPLVLHVGSCLPP